MKKFNFLFEVSIENSNEFIINDVELITMIYHYCKEYENTNKTNNINKITKNISRQLQLGKGFIAFDKEDDPIGYIAFNTQNGITQITSIYINPYLRRNGIGSALINSLFEYILTENLRVCEVILQIEDKRLLNFFEKNGFKKSTKEEFNNHLTFTLYKNL